VSEEDAIFTDGSWMGYLRLSVMSLKLQAWIAPMLAVITDAVECFSILL
jgi:hypothetical protein